MNTGSMPAHEIRIEGSGNEIEPTKLSQYAGQMPPLLVHTKELVPKIHVKMGRQLAKTMKIDKQKKKVHDNVRVIE